MQDTASALDELVKDQNTIAAKLAAADARIVELTAAATSGDPNITVEALRQARDEYDLAKVQMQGVGERLTAELANTPAAESAVILDEDAQAAREAADERQVAADAEMRAADAALVKARATMAKADDRHAAAVATFRAAASDEDHVDVTLAEAFAALAAGSAIFAGPVTVSHREPTTPRAHEVPALHVQQATTTTHGVTTWNVGDKAHAFDGSARGELTLSYFTRAGFEAPSCPEVRALAESTGWKLAGMESNPTVQAIPGDVEVATYRLTIDRGNVLAPLVDNLNEAVGEPQARGWDLDYTVLDQATGEHGATTTKAGVRLAYSMRQDTRFGRIEPLSATDKARAERGVQRVVQGLVGQLGWHGTVRNAALASGRPAWVSKLKSRKLADGYEDGATGYAVVEMTAKKA